MISRRVRDVRKVFAYTYLFISNCYLPAKLEEKHLPVSSRTQSPRILLADKGLTLSTNIVAAAFRWGRKGRCGMPRVLTKI